MYDKRRAPRNVVRDPVQVYLAPDDRKLLEALAEATGLSRAEVLRRGIRSFAAATQGTKSPMLEFLDEMAEETWPEGIAERHDELLTQFFRQGAARFSTPPDG
ncbi:MAG: ribbon-helix-helix protein, CopG family [Gemmatimonadota bacterium]